jgi:hypothetical protein
MWHSVPPKRTSPGLLGLRLSRKLGFAGGKSSRQAVLSVDAVNAVDGVEVLYKSDLEAGGGTLAGGDRGVCEEVFPDLAYSQ